MDLDKYMAEERSHTKETVDYWKSQLDRIRRQLDASEKSLRVALWASICGLVTSILMLVKFLLNVPIPTTACSLDSVATSRNE